MSARSRQQVCVLNEAEAIRMERDGFLANCRDHRHWGRSRAIKAISAGLARLAKPKRIDARDAVVEIPVAPAQEPPMCWRPTLCVDLESGMKLPTMQLVHGVKPGKKGRVSYPDGIPACGATGRTMRVSEINTDGV